MSVAVHEDDLLSLAACAFARERFPELGFHDPLAEELLGEITHERAAFDEGRLRSSVVQTMIVDALAAGFLARSPAGLAVGLLPGLCTRFARIDNGAMQWLDLEPPDVAAFKRQLFPMPARHVIAPCCSVSCSGWMKVLAGANDMPILLIAQGGFRRAAPALRDAFFTNAAQHLPSGTELVIEYDAAAPIRPSSPSGGGALMAQDGSGAWVSYPRIRFVRTSEHDARLAYDLAGVNAVSRLFRGRAMPSVAHLRFT